MIYDYCVSQAVLGEIQDVYEWMTGEAASADPDFDLALSKWTFCCADLQSDEELACGLVAGVQLIFSERDIN